MTETAATIRITGVNLESRCGYVLFVPTERMDARKIVCPFCQEVLKHAH